MDDLFAAFKERAEAVSAEVHRFGTAAEAKAFVLGLANELGGVALCAPGTFLAPADRAQAPGLSFEVSQAAAAGAALGISRMAWALADTGTLVVDATGVEQRLVSTLPPVHLALVDEAGLLPGLGDVLGRIKPVQASYLSMITGPSRTADIERVLTIGVHGPERLVVVFTREVSA